MAITERDLEKVPIGIIDVGDRVVSKTPSGEPHLWQVNAKKLEFSERDGQTVTLKPKPEPGAKHVAGIKAPLNTLVYRVIRRR